MTSIPANIILSRTDSIGDVVLALPLAKVLKDHFPGIKVALLGREYTRSVAEACINIDCFIELQEFLHHPVRIAGELPQSIIHILPERSVAERAKQLHIPLCIGTTNRLYHWTTCNKLVKLSRKKSPLHETQMNLKLLQPFGIREKFTLQAIGLLYGLQPRQALPEALSSLIRKDKYNLILHPRSRGSAREWSLENFIQLIRSLNQDVYRIFISGTKEEQKSLQPLFNEVGDLVTDITGCLTVTELISFIAQCNGLVACSTGPLHLAAALGKDALGLYVPLHSIHPGRWKSVGPKAEAFVVNKSCTDCKDWITPCHCINEISWKRIQDELDKRSAAGNMLSE